MNILEYRTEDKTHVKTFPSLSNLETSIRFFVNYWVYEGIVYENRGNHFQEDRYMINLHECKGEIPYADASKKEPNTIEYRLFHTDRTVIKETKLRHVEDVMLALSLDQVCIEDKTYHRLSIEFDEDRSVYVYYLNG